MKRSILCVLASAIAFAAFPPQALACKCMAPDIARSYNSSDHVAKIHIIGQLFFSPSGHKRFLGLTDESFKGCLSQGQWVLVDTRSESAACGVDLSSKTYLLSGSDQGSALGMPIIGVTRCDSNTPWSELSDGSLDFLYTRYNCCGDSCACTDGTQPVNCFVNPCAFSTCGDAEATCASNYCGGCRAEWYDATGAIADCSETGDDGSITCSPSEENSCADTELVCVAKTVSETGTCEPFRQGARVGAGYACGGSIGVSCAEGLFCKGLPYHTLGGSGVCTLMDCADWSEEYSRFVDAHNTCTDASDCQSISGTSCGCTRDLVLSKNADMATFQNLVELMSADGCNPFISPCDCPTADGFKCESGRCAWNYTGSQF